MQIVEFYRGERGNTNNDMLADILTWTNGRLEMGHDWVQWVFPSNEPSRLNSDAPTMTLEESQYFEANVDLQQKVLTSFKRYLQFLDMTLIDGDVPTVEVSENTPWWLRNFNHNMLRVTRVLKCLRLTGNTKYAQAFYNALRPYTVAPEGGHPIVSHNTAQHWRNAIFDSLW